MSGEIGRVLAEAVRSEEARRACVQRMEEAARERRIREQRDKQDEESRRKQLQKLQHLREKQTIINQYREFQDSQKRAEGEEGKTFLRTYLLIHGLRLTAVENGTYDKIKELISGSFGYPWDRLAYTQEELEALPRVLGDRQAMYAALSLGLWPFKRDPSPPSRRDVSREGRQTVPQTISNNLLFSKKNL